MVVNCAAVTKYGQDDAIYKENILDLSVASATEAAKRGVLFIELSTAQVYNPDKVWRMQLKYRSASLSSSLSLLYL